ncbi:hypothetical protein GCM10018785_53190 [Streptomyces longispororuber]|uniref:Nucleotidyl transferase AbiEii/AbiGii toxin family protein n=1 Tax=Streptomyces longispororuber TaxID=68230 RepID=A0A918ZYJ9_9ACTN|nr:nucleotidyl transferase AbiEii/AbiGii toxin family protein [Streptomyces longispororuber]GHE78392.1 hypothetical protein GCM10018785_53190 [Streptomyces longispororuber]
MAPRQQRTDAPGASGEDRRADWGSRPLADRHHLLALAIALHSFRAALTPGTWYLKGSAALSAWLGPAARLPNDLDLVVPAGAARRLLASGELPPGPRGESLRVARHEPIVFSSGSAPTVYRALLEIRGPEELPPVLLGLLLVGEGETREGKGTTLLDFPGPTGAVTVPSVTAYRFLAQKLLRYSRRRGGGRVNTHWRDLSDMLTAAAHPAFPTLRLGSLCADLATEMADHGRTHPLRLPEPPAEWLDFWDTAVFVEGLPFGRLPEAAQRLSRFWEPVLRRPEDTAGEHAPGEEADPRDAVWSPDEWRWNNPGPNNPGRSGEPCRSRAPG